MTIGLIRICVGIRHLFLYLELPLYVKIFEKSHQGGSSEKFEAWYTMIFHHSISDSVPVIYPIPYSKLSNRFRTRTDSVPKNFPFCPGTESDLGTESV